MPNWSPVAFPPTLLEEGTIAPVDVPDEPPGEYTVVLAHLMHGVDIPPTALNKALATGTIFLYGARQFVCMANRLVAAPTSGAKEEREKIVVELQVTASTFAREQQAAYAIAQIGGLLSSRRGAPPKCTTALRRHRQRRKLLAPLEDALEASGAARNLDPQRYAQLVIQLDAFYDAACHQLERAADLASRPLDGARRLGPGFLTDLYEGFVRGAVDDHVIVSGATEDAGGGDADAATAASDDARGKGLLDLLPELIEAVRH